MLIHFFQQHTFHVTILVNGLVLYWLFGFTSPVFNVWYANIQADTILYNVSIPPQTSRKLDIIFSGMR